MDFKRMIKQIKKFNQAQQELTENIKTMNDLSIELSNATVNYIKVQNEQLKQINQEVQNILK